MAGISVPGTCRACPSSTHRSEHLSTIYTSLLSLPKLPLQIPHTHTIPHGHSTIPGPRNHFPVFGIHFARHTLGTLPSLGFLSPRLRPPLLLVLLPLTLRKTFPLSGISLPIPESSGNLHIISGLLGILVSLV